MLNILLTTERLTVTSVMLAAVVLIIHKNGFLSIATSDVLKGWTFIWNYFNCIVLNAPGHRTVAQEEGLILLM